MQFIARRHSARRERRAKGHARGGDAGMGMTMDSDIRRRANTRRSPLTFVRENWRAISIYLLISGVLLFGLTQAQEITLGILQFIAQLLFAMMIASGPAPDRRPRIESRS